MQLQPSPSPPPESNQPDPNYFKDADCIIFDCDGVLVDVSESYYATIKETVFFVLNDLPPSRYTLLLGKDDLVNLPIIEMFKNAGRFNDEIDLSCAIILGAAAAMRLTTDVTPSKYQQIIDDIVNHSASGGITSVISYVQKMIADVSDAIAYMEHPSDDRTGKLCRIFDQIFFGPQIYLQIRRNQPLDDKISNDYIMIDRDRTIITEPILQSLYEYFNGHVALLTGRGIYSAKHTLGTLLKYFDVDNSAFLEDEPREYAKPNPVRLLQCIQNMGCKKAIYVGDSAEDAIMASELSSSNATTDVIFCGISGTNLHTQGHRRNMLINRGASVVLDSVLDIPKALNLAV